MGTPEQHKSENLDGQPSNPLLEVLAVFDQGHRYDPEEKNTDTSAPLVVIDNYALIKLIERLHAESPSEFSSVMTRLRKDGFAASIMDARYSEQFAEMVASLVHALQRQDPMGKTPHFCSDHIVAILERLQDYEGSDPQLADHYTAHLKHLTKAYQVHDKEQHPATSLRQLLGRAANLIASSPTIAQYTEILYGYGSEHPLNTKPRSNGTDASSSS